ncbi:ElaA protein [Leucobacter exalbidus]|uniref:ElaA protein n=1 Tax=Leucobacter exalbidus TaxID=662960 RepID=A0A940T4B2_9MICO|nr:GNAT family N-acetyltransferase [Leucobacter exalbidus]MBP1326654.1 ElaA protein [Leucobacter exalbidus]
MSITPDQIELPDGLTLRITESLDELPARTFYAIAKLRQEIFVVEQNCVYLDLDGRDLEPGCLQMWAEGPAGEIATSVRILDETADEAGLMSIGRVVTAPAWRGRGAAGALLRAAIAHCGTAAIRIHAQAHLADWYARFGFRVTGDVFLEDDIPHVEMRIR